MSEIIVHKKVVVSAEDRITSVLARTNQAISNLENHLSQLGMKFNSSASDTAQLKTSLSEVRANSNETATSINKLNADINKLKGDKKVTIEANTSDALSRTERLRSNINQLANKKPVIKPEVDDRQAQGGFTRIKRGANEAGEAGKHMVRNFALGGMISNGIQSAANSLAGFAKQGFLAAQASEQMTSRWRSFGMTAGEIRSTGAAVRDLKENTDLSGQAAGNLVTRMYGLTGSTRQAIALSKGVGAIADQLNLTGQRADAFAGNLNRIEASGKVTSQSLGRLEKQAPGLGTALQKASGMSKKSFDTLVSSGKMTSDQLNDILLKASANYRKNASDWEKTSEGASHHLKQTWQDAWQAMMTPLVSSAGTGLNALSKALETLRPEFLQLGAAVSNLATKFAQWLTPQHARDLGEIVSSLGHMVVVIGKGVWDTFAGIAETVGKMFGVWGRSSDGLDNVANALEHISQNRIAVKVMEGVGSAIATYYVYSKLSKAASALHDMYTSLKDIASLSVSKIAAVIAAGQGNYSGDSKILQGVSHSRSFGKTVGPSGVLKQEEAEAGVAGDKAGQSFISRLIARIAQTRIGGKIAYLFLGVDTAAGIAGTKSGGSFLSRFGAMLGGGRMLSIGRTMAGRVGAGLSIGLSVIDVLRALTPSFKGDRWTMMGKGAGGLIGAGIGGYFGGPAGAAIGGGIGNVVGGWLGKAAHKGFNILRDVFHGRITFSGIEHGFAETMSKVGKWAQDTWKKIKAWWNEDPTEEGRKKAEKNASKEPSQHEIRSLGGNHYSKADIANIKAMNAAVKAYTNTLRTLKATIRKNDPTKELNSMNKALKQSAKYWLAVSKPLKQASKAFQSMRKPLETINKSMKGLTGKKSSLGTFDKDLTKLNKDLRSSKLGEQFEKLSKKIKKSDLVKTLQKLAKEVRDSVKYWKEFAKPIKETTSELQKFDKEVKPYGGKNNPLDKLDKSVQDLTKTLKKNRFGNMLAQQMQVANKSMNGRNSVEAKFTQMTRTIERDLSRFKSTFNHDWRNVWSRLSEQPSRGLSQVVSIVGNRFNAIRSRESSFINAFNSAWRRWASGVVSTMQNEFGKLPGIAQKAMSEIVDRLNRGIRGVNSVIDQFGGDKHLGMISYARGTLVHPGGKAILNDGPSAQKQEIVWEPSRGFSLPQGQYQVRDLERGAMVLDAEHSAPILKSAGIIPHYDAGTLSEDEQDKISEEFMNNPIQASKNLILKLTNWNGAAIFGSLGKAMAIGFSRGIANVLKDMLGIIKEPVNGDWTPVIKSAFHLLHMSAQGWQIAKFLKQIQTESNGNEHAVQAGADPDGDGSGPAIGLLQFKRRTFANDALPGHTNIFSGFDQILAAIKTLNAGGEGGWGNFGMGHGWASGGHITSLEHAWLADNPEHDEYVINPYSDTALPLMNDAYRTMSMSHPEWRQPDNSAFNNQLIKLVAAAVDKLDNIDIRPVVDVQDVTKATNKENALSYSLMKN